MSSLPTFYQLTVILYSDHKVDIYGTEEALSMAINEFKEWSRKTEEEQEREEPVMEIHGYTNTYDRAPALVAFHKDAVYFMLLVRMT